MKKNKFSYWFDKQMSKGSIAMILLLSLFSIVCVLFISILIQCFGMSEGDFPYTFWNSLATVINAWMPYSDEGGIGYILLTAICAIIGLLFTSVLIGIVGSAIEDRITQLRKGNSPVIEKNHSVILGFVENEYSLLNQMVNVKSHRHHVIVVADTMERDEMETMIKENIEIPDNVTLICRKVDTTDPQSMKCLALEDAKVIVVNHVEDTKTICSIMAVRKLLRNINKDVQIVTSITDDFYMLPENKCCNEKILVLQTSDIIARIIAHSCTLPGISDVFSTMFSYVGEEFYSKSFERCNDKTFKELIDTVNEAIPVGIIRDNQVILNPKADERIEINDELLYFSKNKNSITFISSELTQYDPIQKVEEIEKNICLGIIGYNDSLKTIINELPNTISKVEIATNFDPINTEPISIDCTKYCQFELELSDESLNDFVSDKDHIIILGNHSLEDYESDVFVSIMLMKLRDLKSIYQYTYMMTAEMKTEKYRKLASVDDPTDFIVARDISSMILSQVSSNYKLHGLFKELLSNKGNELYMKAVSLFQLDGCHTVRELRNRLYDAGFIFIGYRKNECNYFSLNLEDEVTLHSDDYLIVIGEI